MKLFAAGCLVAALATVAVQIGSGATTRDAGSIPQRVKTLESKVKSLSASVAKLKSDVGTLTARSSCLGAQGVMQFGNPAAGQGYAYTNDGGNTLVLTTAFDAPASGQTPTFYAATVNPSCVTGSDNRAFRLGHAVAAHGTAPLPSP